MKEKHSWGNYTRKVLFLFSMLILSSGYLSAQNKSISGTVKYEAGDPVIAASVKVKGTTIGTVTNLEGAFRLDVPVNSQTLIISYIGLKTQEIAIDRAVFNIIMQDDVNQLDEIVAIGYGTVKKRDLTGSVTSVKEEIIMRTPTGNPMQALQGRITGLDFTKDANNNDVMVMRGHRSINSKNDPLIIIDGVQGGSYKDVNPADIASIDILKDASSTAIYGSQGANGVIIITTKSPEKGKLNVSYNAYAGWNMWADENERRVGDSWIAPRRIAAKNAGLWNTDADDHLLFPNIESHQAFKNNEWTDYRELMSQKPFVQNHSLSFSGGTETTNARFSVGWEEEEAKRKGGISDKFNLQAVINHKLSSWLSAGVNLRLAHSMENESPYDSDGGWNLGKPYDADNNIIVKPVGQAGYVNPLIDGFYENMRVNKEYATRISATGFIEAKPIKGLTYRSQLNTNLALGVEGSYTDKNSSGQIDGTKQSSSSMEVSTGKYLEWNNILSYDKSINDHTFGITALTAWTKSMDEGLRGYGTNQLISKNLWYALQGTTNQMISSYYSQKQMFSYAARVNYGYKGRYLFTASMRRDGSSTLSKGHNWDEFPSAAIAWRINEESFMESTSHWLDNLKLRLTYGVTGNSDIPEYATKSGVQAFNNKLALQDKPLLHYDFTNAIGNQDTKWEKSANIDLGIDFSLFKERINGTIDIYNTNTYDLLLARNLPSSAGADGNFTIMTNIGRTNNKGIEIMLNATPVKTKDFSWSTTLTFSRNIEKIVDLVNGKNITLTTDIEKSTLMIGRPIQSYYGYKYMGIWTTDEADEAAAYFKNESKTQSFRPGDYKILDRDTNNIISTSVNNKGDYDFIGSQTPDWFAGFDHNFKYKNFDLNIYFFFRWGQFGENPVANIDPATGGNYTLYDDWFFVEGVNEKGAKLPPLNAGYKAYDYYGYQSLWYVDRSFFKIKNMSLGYTLPKSVLDKIGVENLRVYVSAANPFYYAKSSWMKGLDPENALRNYITGIQLTF